MSRNYFDRDTPIVALATPEGRSALAIIRTSGEAAIDIVARCFSRPEALLGAAGYQAVHGWIIDPLSNERIDEVMALVYKAPHSFTGENAVEILCHGSAAAMARPQWFAGFWICFICKDFLLLYKENSLFGLLLKARQTWFVLRP